MLCTGCLVWARDYPEWFRNLVLRHLASLAQDVSALPRNCFYADYGLQVALSSLVGTDRHNFEDRKLCVVLVIDVRTVAGRLLDGILISIDRSEAI